LFILKQEQKDHVHELPPLLPHAVRRVTSESTTTHT
jgi:hypothetical protein